MNQPGRGGLTNIPDTREPENGRSPRASEAGAGAPVPTPLDRKWERYSETWGGLTQRGALALRDLIREEIAEDHIPLRRADEIVQQVRDHPPGFAARRALCPAVTASDQPFHTPSIAEPNGQAPLNKTAVFNDEP